MLRPRTERRSGFSVRPKKTKVASAAIQHKFGRQPPPTTRVAPSTPSFVPEMQLARAVSDDNVDKVDMELLDEYLTQDIHQSNLFEDPAKAL